MKKISSIDAKIGEHLSEAAAPMFTSHPAIAQLIRRISEACKTGDKAFLDTFEERLQRVKNTSENCLFCGKPHKREPHGMCYGGKSSI